MINKCDTQHNGGIVMLSAVYAECHKPTHYAEWRYAECCYAKCRYAKCHLLSVVMLSVIMLSVVMLSVITLNVIMLSVAVPIFNIMPPCCKAFLAYSLQQRSLSVQNETSLLLKIPCPNIQHYN
jgi:hypothetical protein